MLILIGMVIYDLICRHGHKFEGWFPGREAFEVQQGKGLVECQVCGDPHVSKIPSGGHFLKSGASRHAAQAPQTEAESAMPAMLATGAIDGVTVLKALKHYVRTHFEDVGQDFATVARKMHAGEIPVKNVYGVATPEEMEKLDEDEIPHFMLPGLPPEFEN